MARSRYDQAQYMNAVQEAREFNRQIRAAEAASFAHQAAIAAEAARRREIEREARDDARYREYERRMRPLRSAVYGRAWPPSARDMLRELRRESRYR